MRLFLLSLLSLLLLGCFQEKKKVLTAEEAVKGSTFVFNQKEFEREFKRNTIGDISVTSPMYGMLDDLVKEIMPDILSTIEEEVQFSKDSLCTITFRDTTSPIQTTYSITSKDSVLIPNWGRAKETMRFEYNRYSQSLVATYSDGKISFSMEYTKKR